MGLLKYKARIMTNEQIFAARVQRINKASVKTSRVKSRSARGFGERLITPLMFVLCVAGGMTAAWDAMERPTSNPLELATDLTDQLLSYLDTI